MSGVVVNLTFDSGALIAVEKNASRIRSLLRKRNGDAGRVTVPAAVLAQVWRGNSPLVARLLSGATIEDLDETMAKAVGLLLASSRTADVVDAVVVVGAIRRGDAIVTSDPDDIRRLLEAAGVGRVTIIEV